MDLFLLEPYFVGKPWGGGHLDSIRPHDADQSVGEMILASSIDAFETKIVGGPSFQHYWQSEGLKKAQSLGFQGWSFPFLLKILSTKEPLSIQVHPSDANVKQLGLTGYGKFESWLMLDRDEDARLYLGKKNPSLDLTALEELRDPLNEFNELQTNQGDIFILEPGLIHGTKGRLLFFEIQQPSNYTFRIHDFGRGRELHLEQASAVSKDVQVQRSSWAKPLQCPAFEVETVALKEKVTNYETNLPFQVQTYIGPSAKLKGKFGASDISWGSTFFTFFGSGFSIELGSASTSSSLPFANSNEALLFRSSPSPI